MQRSPLVGCTGTGRVCSKLGRVDIKHVKRGSVLLLGKLLWTLNQIYSCWTIWVTEKKKHLPSSPSRGASSTNKLSVCWWEACEGARLCCGSDWLVEYLLRRGRRGVDCGWSWRDSVNICLTYGRIKFQGLNPVTKSGNKSPFCTFLFLFFLL